MSPSDAAPVARHGLPKKPCRKRRMMKPAKLRHTDAPMERSRYMKKVVMYIGFRPICGISLSGEKSSGPRPSVGEGWLAKGVVL